MSSLCTLCKYNTNSKVRAMPAYNKRSTPFPAGGFPPDTAQLTRPEAQACPQFNRPALDSNGWV